MLCYDSMQVWSLQTGLLLVSARGHTGEVSDLALSCDGALLASGATDGEVRVWSMQVRTAAAAVSWCVLLHRDTCDCSRLSGSSGQWLAPDCALCVLL
jgi:WD40 repeat protein